MVIAHRLARPGEASQKTASVRTEMSGPFSALDAEFLTRKP